HFIDDFSFHHPGAKQIDHEMAWVHIRDDHLTYGNFLASCQAHSSGTFCIAQNFLDQRVRADFSAMRLQMFGESERNAVHPSFDELVAGVLQDRSEEPTELGATRIVGRGAEKKWRTSRTRFSSLLLRASGSPTIGRSAC